ncbi:hypothetical protein [Bosea sp. PAMC 26642]|uniref:hypothetical protein n=1 Tax=Bosea sp. (strain PAMC 26642) TaxID=1792307 RepID=UPI0007704178|nr:hypothetical protein [Bosea sp. PAMC 26642]AMJ59030.1 hypothetical protein AXW83_00825 [Bosea sp. PAMC 26642]
MMAFHRLAATAVATALAAAPASAAEAWNIPHEEPAVLKGKVVDALCHLKGRCAPDCGGGKRQLGLVLGDGTFRLVAKSNVDFAGAIRDLAGFCGREIEADGLLIENPAVTLFFVQGVRSDPAQPFVPAERFKADWEAQHGKAEEWWRADPEANRIIAEDGPFGRKDIKPK